MADGPSPYNFPANNKKAAEAASAPSEPERPKVEKVISGEAEFRKPSLGRRIKASFTGDDMQSVGNYLLLDVAVPALKSLISDVVSQGVDKALFGSGPGRRTTASGIGSKVLYTGYNAISTAKAQAAQVPPPTPVKDTPRWNEIVLPDRSQAEAVLVEMIERQRNYGTVTVNDLLDMVGITGNFTDLRLGWVADMLDRASIRRVSGGGFLLDLPAPVDLKK